MGLQARHCRPYRELIIPYIDLREVDSAANAFFHYRKPFLFVPGSGLRP
jgi:hypothetical protein